MTVSVSVIIPTFNRWPILCRAIDSVLNQSHAPAEIIIIDDGSTDGTANFLQTKYASKIDLHLQANAGVSAARNTGISKSKGNWIALLDSDDEWLPDKLKNQVEVINDNPDCVLCHTEEIWIRNGTRVNQMKKHKKAGGNIFEQCLPLCAISPSSAIISRKLLDTVGNFDESLPACEDYDLWLRVCANHPVHFIGQPMLIKYGGHEDQLSRKYWGMDRFRIQALQKLLDAKVLTDEKHNKTLKMLSKKTKILLNGAIKHSNASLIAECRSILTQYEIEFPEPINPDPINLEPIKLEPMKPEPPSC